MADALPVRSASVQVRKLLLAERACWGIDEAANRVGSLVGSPLVSE